MEADYTCGYSLEEVISYTKLGQVSFVKYLILIAVHHDHVGYFIEEVSKEIVGVVPNEERRLITRASSSSQCLISASSTNGSSLGERLKPEHRLDSGCGSMANTSRSQGFETLTRSHKVLPSRVIKSYS